MLLAFNNNSGIPLCLRLPGRLEVQLHATRAQQGELKSRVVRTGRRIGVEDVETALQRLTGAVSAGSVTAFLCGPPGMVDEMSAMLRDLGLVQARIRAEKWW